MTAEEHDEQNITVRVPGAAPVLTPMAARALLRLLLRAADHDKPDDEMSGEQAA